MVQLKNLELAEVAVVVTFIYLLDNKNLMMSMMMRYNTSILHTTSVDVNRVWRLNICENTKVGENEYIVSGSFNLSFFSAGP